MPVHICTTAEEKYYILYSQLHLIRHHLIWHWQSGCKDLRTMRRCWLLIPSPKYTEGWVYEARLHDFLTAGLSGAGLSGAGLSEVDCSRNYTIARYTI